MAIDSSFNMKKDDKQNLVVSITMSIIVILFIVAKLFGFSTLTWFWTLAPFWLPILALLMVLFVGLFGYAIYKLFQRLNN